MKGFYTAKEAQAKLGISQDRFQYLVRIGVIERVILPGRKYGVYPESEVNRLSGAINATIEQYTKDTSIFEQASEEDLPEIYVLLHRPIRMIPSIKELEGWMQHNPEIFYTLRNKGVLVGYACILPISKTWLNKTVLNRKEPFLFSLQDIPLNAIRTPQKLNTVSDILIDLNVVRGDRKEITHYAQRLLLEVGHALKRFEARGASIKTLYALPITAKAQDFCRRIVFEEVIPPRKGRWNIPWTPIEWVLYRLNVADATRHLVRHFREESENHEVRTEKVQAPDSEEQSSDQ